MAYPGNHSPASGWEVIRLRNERMARAEANRRPAWSADEATGTVRFAEQTFHQTASYVELCLDAAELEAELEILLGVEFKTAALVS